MKKSPIKEQVQNNVRTSQKTAIKDPTDADNRQNSFVFYDRKFLLPGEKPDYTRRIDRLK